MEIQDYLIAAFVLKQTNHLRRRVYLTNYFVRQHKYSTKSSVNGIFLSFFHLNLCNESNATELKFHQYKQ